MPLPVPTHASPSPKGSNTMYIKPLLIYISVLCHPLQHLTSLTVLTYMCLHPHISLHIPLLISSIKPCRRGHCHSHSFCSTVSELYFFSYVHLILLFQLTYPSPLRGLFSCWLLKWWWWHCPHFLLHLYWRMLHCLLAQSSSCSFNFLHSLRVSNTFCQRDFELVESSTWVTITSVGIGSISFYKFFA